MQWGTIVPIPSRIYHQIGRELADLRYAKTLLQATGDFTDMLKQATSL